MQWKRLLAALLACASLAVLALPASAGYFPDVTDPEMARAADTLYALGVVDGGDKGLFQPMDNLTRVQFCKMAIEIMGRGEEAKAQMNRTIFTDVASTHWGRGYVNLAATMVIDEENKTRLMLGTGNGKFEPDRAISYQEAVTLMLRILGYSAEANASWPTGAIRTATELGLDRGLNIAVPSAAVTRGQAAVLFSRMLAITPKGGEKPYAQALGTLVEDVIILSTNATINCQSGWVTTTQGGPYRPVGTVDSSLQGQRGDILLDKNGQFITLLTNNTDSVTTTITRVQGNYLHTANGSRYTFADDTPVYTGTNGQVSTYKEMLPSLLPGQAVTIYLDDGQVVGMFCARTATDSGFVVVEGRASAATFFSITGGETGYTIRKNGAAISLGDIQPYDVATYDPISKVLNICDTRLTCVYENASPSPLAPSLITAAGGNTFPVMAGAMDSLAQFSLGQTVILLFTSDGQVAGAVQRGVAGNAMGVVSGDSLKLIGTNVTLKVGASAAGMDGQLVSVSGGWGDLSLRPVSLSHGSGDFDTVRMTLGRLPVSYGVMIYEQGANGLASVSLSSLPSSVPSSRISGYHTDSAGYVDLILLRDYTGDTYTYGRIEPASKTVEVPVKGKEPFTTNEETGEIRDAEGFLVNAEGNRLDTEGNVLTEKKEIPQLRFVVPGKSTVYDLPDGMYAPTGFGTIRVFTDPNTGTEYATVNSLLTAVPNARSADFYIVDGVTYVQVGSRTYEVADDVLCYNAAASHGWWYWDPELGDYAYAVENQWFETLLEARTFSPTLTLYVDSTGGKVRVVSAQ